MTENKLTTVKLTPYTTDNPPKAGDIVFVSESSWYEPYRGQQKRVVHVVSDETLWLEGDEDYDSGVCEFVKNVQKIEVIVQEGLQQLTPFSKDNQPAVGEVCILVDADGCDPLLQVVGRKVVVERQMDRSGHLYVKLPEGNSYNFYGYYVDIWQLAPISKGDTGMTEKTNTYSEDNRPNVGDKVVLLHSDCNADAYLGQTFTVIRDDFDYCPILIDCPVFQHGLYVSLTGIAPAPISDDTQAETISVYDLPCDFKVGDRVTCLLYGDGVVTAESSCDKYPITVSFDSGESNGYTSEGKYYAEDATQRVLFHAGTVKLVVDQEAVNKLATKYIPQYKEGQLLYAAKDGKVQPIYVGEDKEDRIVSNFGGVFLKAEQDPEEGYTFFEAA
jgi:hypothetical protein